MRLCHLSENTFDSRDGWKEGWRGVICLSAKKSAQILYLLLDHGNL